MQQKSRILIVGHKDSLENSLWNYFRLKKFSNVYTNSRHKLDVLSQKKVEAFFKRIMPEYVFLGSVRSGSIAANQKSPAEFIYENLAAQNNVIQAAYKFKVKKLIFFAASCVYPKHAKQPIKEESLLTGPMEETSEAYSIAKLGGIKLCQAYQRQYGLNTLIVVPATLYGPGSDMDMQTAHVLGGLMAKFNEAVRENHGQVVVWGTGRPLREFLYVDDFVEGVLFLLKKYKGTDIVNLGAGQDVTIKGLANMIAKVTGFKGKIIFDRSKPDGTMRKLLDSSRINRCGWKPKTKLFQGVEKTYEWYKYLDKTRA